MQIIKWCLSPAMWGCLWALSSLPVLAIRLRNLPVFLCVHFVVKLMPDELCLFPHWHEIYFTKSSKWLCTGEIAAGFFGEVLMSKSRGNATLLPHRKSSWYAEAKHELREGAAASPLEADGRLGVLTWPTERDVGCLCLPRLWRRPSGAKSAWDEIKQSDMCLRYLPNINRATRGLHCGFKSKYSLQWCGWSEKRKEMACSAQEAMSARVSWEAARFCRCQVSSPGATACSQRDCAAPGWRNAMPRLGPLDIVVLQINNRVWAADVACNTVSQVFQRTWCLMCWAGGKACLTFRCLLARRALEKVRCSAAGSAFSWVSWLMSSARPWG